MIIFLILVSLPGPMDEKIIPREAMERIIIVSTALLVAIFLMEIPFRQQVRSSPYSLALLGITWGMLCLSIATLISIAALYLIFRLSRLVHRLCDFCSWIVAKGYDVWVRRVPHSTARPAGTPGMLVMYKLKEEDIWWPAVHYSSHTLARPFIKQEKLSTDCYQEFFEQYLKESDKQNPSKPLVRVLGHPNKTLDKEWWYQIDDAGKTEAFSLENVAKYIEATPEPFNDSLRRTLAKLANRLRVDRDIQSGEAVPYLSPEDETVLNGSPMTDRNASRSVQVPQYDIATGASAMIPEGPSPRNNMHQTKEHVNLPLNKMPSDGSKGDKRRDGTAFNFRAKQQDTDRALSDLPGTADFNVTLARLKKEGWKILQGGPLEGYHYLRPGVNKGEGKEGVDYFTNKNDAFDFYIAEHEDSRSYYSKRSYKAGREGSNYQFTDCKRQANRLAKDSKRSKGDRMFVGGESN